LAIQERYRYRTALGSTAFRWKSRNRRWPSVNPPTEHRRGVRGQKGESVKFGDVAGPGEDETVLVVRDGPWIILSRAWKQADPRGEVVSALRQYEGHLEVINVDSAGIGWNMYTHLSDIFPGITHPVNVGEAPHDSEKYANLKAELFWGLRMRAQAGDLLGYLDEKLVGQLAGIRYKHNARGQVVIESKEDARKRGVKSPDRAEAVMLAFAQHELAYGLIAFMDELEHRVNADRLQQMRQMADTLGGGRDLSNGPGEARVPKRSCPECGAVCIARAATGGHRCSMCGHQWDERDTSRLSEIPSLTRHR